MKSIKAILILIIGVLIIPIFSLFVLSFKATDGQSLKWYVEILNNYRFTTAFVNSFTTSIIVSIIATLVCFLISLAYYDKKTKLLVIFITLLLGLMPPDITAVTINKLAQIIGFYRSNVLFLYFGLLIYCLPFGVIILWTRYYFIEKGILVASEDLGLNNKSIILKIIMPLSKSALISVFLFSFLLSFNEYTRTYYLSGSEEYLSEFLNGKLSSGTDNSIYAGATISILITCCIIGLYGLYSKMQSKRI